MSWAPPNPSPVTSYIPVSGGLPSNAVQVTGVDPGSGYHFSWSSFLIGLLIGMAILALLVWLAYSQRWLFFDQCIVSHPHCTNSDYYETPSDALRYTPVKTSDILHVRNGVLYYKRVPKQHNCTPGSDQSVPIEFPQVCDFTGTDGTDFEATIGMINMDFNQATYTSPGHMVLSGPNCVPVTGAVSGVPVAKWTVLE